MEYVKIDDSTIQVTKESEVIVSAKTTVYSVDFLKRQELDIIAQRDEMISRKDAELAEVRVLLAECKKLGIK